MAEALIERLDRTIDLILTRRRDRRAGGREKLAPLARTAYELRSCPSAAFKRGCGRIWKGRRRWRWCSKT